MSYNVTLFGLEFTLSPVAFTIPLGSRALGYILVWHNYSRGLFAGAYLRA